MGIYFCEFDRNSRKPQKIVPAKISTIRVDDLVTGGNNFEEVKENKQNSVQLLKKGDLISGTQTCLS